MKSVYLFLFEGFVLKHQWKNPLFANIRAPNQTAAPSPRLALPATSAPGCCILLATEREGLEVELNSCWAALVRTANLGGSSPSYPSLWEDKGRQP